MRLSIKALVGVGLLILATRLSGEALAAEGYHSLTVDQIDSDSRQATISRALSAAAQLFPVGGYDGWFLTGASRIVSEGSAGPTDQYEIHIAGEISPGVVLALDVVFAEANTLSANEYGTLAVAATIRRYHCDGTFLQRETYYYGTKKFWRAPQSQNVRVVPPDSVFGIEERSVCRE